MPYELIIKALHIIFVVTWFAALFYLPRLFVYHATTTDEPGNERFKIMERRLFIMMTIGAVLAVFFGIWLWLGFGISGTWLIIKLVLVAMLILFHLYCGKLVRIFANDANKKSERFYRMLNEIPTLILIAVVFLAVLKPFSASP